MVGDLHDGRPDARGRSGRHATLKRAGEALEWSLGAHLALTFSPLTPLAFLIPAKYLLLAYVLPSILFGLYMTRGSTAADESPW